MYEAYFHLQKRPFSATPDASCFYAPEPIQKLFDELLLAARSGQGIGVLTAAAGTGKSLVCRRLVAELERQFTPIFLANANFSTRRELLQTIHFELGRRFSGIEEQELRLDVIASLESLAASGRPAVLIVDEAHLLSERLLEELRSLATLARDAEPLLRMILVGQMALEMRLVEPSLEALNQRIVYHGYLDPLTREQSREYAAYRIGWAGGDATQLFEAEALERIAEACNGLPRCLNQLCDHSLLLTFVQEAPRVTRAIVDDALADLRQLPLHWNESLGLADELMDQETDAAESREEDSSEGQALTPGWNDERTSAEATATFEIGSDADREPVESVEFASPTLASNVSTSPWMSATPTHPMQPPAAGSETMSVLPEQSGKGVRVYREEFVEDRYAALDRGMSHRGRTFEESAIPEGRREVRQPLVPQAPVAPSLDRAEERRHEAAALQNQEARVEPAIAPRPTLPVTNSNEDEVLDRNAQLIEQTVSAAAELEEEINNSVLDVFADVQTSLNQWWELPSADSVAGASVDARGLAPRAASPYDVVEPDLVRDFQEEDDELAAEERSSPPAGRYVPKPNYRHMFSKLRRQAGRFAR